MDSKQIQYILKVAECQNITRAAEQLHVSQPALSHFISKAEEELGELRQAVEQGANVEEELGDLLFAAVKVGRFAGLDSEQALHGTCEKFIRRFRRVEELAGGRPLDSLGLHRLEELWQQAKQDEA